VQLGSAVALAHLAPRHRVLQVEPREGVSAAGQAQDLIDLLHAFGFEAPVLIGGLAVVLAAVWQPGLVGAIVVADPLDDDIFDVPALLKRVQVPLLTFDALEAFLKTPS